TNNPHPAIDTLMASTQLSSTLVHLETIDDLAAAIRRVPAEELVAAEITPAFEEAGPGAVALVSGSGFGADAWVSLGRGVVVRDVQPAGHLLAVHFNVRPGAKGVKHLAVTSDSGEVTILPDAFTIATASAAPRIIKLAPGYGRVGEKVTLEIAVEGDLGTAEPTVQLSHHPGDSKLPPD